MSVPKGKRKDAYSKFEQKMIDIHKVTTERLESVPVRYQKIINEEIYALTDRAYSNIILADDIKPKSEEKIAQRNSLLQNAIDNLQKLQIPLWVFWDICKYDERRMSYWSGLINEELLILNKIVGDGREEMLIHTINWKSVNEAVFLNNMSELHRYTYGKISHVPKKYYGYVSAEIIKCVDNAWCFLLLGDGIRPEIQKDVKRRASLFQKAKAQLNKLQRPLYALWNVEKYSEREMNEWSGMIDQELKLISGVIKSDVKRYSNILK